MNITNSTPSTLEENEPAPNVPQASNQPDHSEPPPVENSQEMDTEPDASDQTFAGAPRSRREFLWSALAFAAGLGSGYILWGYAPPGSLDESRPSEAAAASEQVSPGKQLNLPDSYTLPVAFGDLGPQLLAAGAIDYDRFVRLYQETGQPLSEEQLEILGQGSDQPVIIARNNAHFLLNFFWAVGLTNQNALLEDGPLLEYSEGEVERFASTGGWTLATQPIRDLYASAPLIPLTPAQQTRLGEVANAVYRPCCNNSTAFPDCNHGMAMLGMLELLAAQEATVDEIFTAAKYLNAFWFPQQSYEIALLFKQGKGQDFAEAGAREFVGPNLASSSGFQTVHQWLAENNLLEQVPNGGNSCGVS